MNANKVRSLISNELWNSFNINEIKVKDFQEVMQPISKLKTAEDKALFKELCIKEISETQKAPVIPRFLATVCGKHPVDDKYAFSVFDEYYHNNKNTEVEFLGETLLQFNESSYILKALAECYESKNQEDKKIACWERLIKTDHTETDVFYKLAAYYEKIGQKDVALKYYKRVIQRHINQADIQALKEVWPTIMSYHTDNADYLIQIASRIAKTMGNEKGVFFLNEILNKKFDINSNIKILKMILNLSNNNKDATDRIISLFREKYIENPRLEYCLSNTGLLHNYMDSGVAVEKFEKEIEFVEGAFVYHNTWKLGRIKKIEQDQMQIQFLSKKDLHPMTCNMAFSSLKVLPKQHIIVLKAGAPAEKIKQKMLENIEWGLRMLFTSFNGELTMKTVKNELVPSILSEKEWTTWSAAAKKELTSNAYFGTSDSSNDVYILRETPITFEEKTLQVFSREKGFFKKYDILKEFVKNNGNTDSEEFVKIMNYFENEIKTLGAPCVCSYLILNEYKNKYGMSFIKLDFNISDYYKELNIEQIKQIYSEIQDSELKKQFVNLVMENDSNPNKTLNALLHVNQNNYIVDCISKKTMTCIRKDALDNYQADPDFVLWLLKETDVEEWDNIGITEDEMINFKLQLLLYVNTKVAHDVDNQVNRARAKQLTDSLFAGQELVNNLSKCDTSQAKRIYSYVSNIPELDDDKKIGIKHYILANRKDADSIVANTNTEITNERIIPKGFLCTKKMFDLKSAELEHIMNVEIPENSKEIGTARDLGDLRENAEYQYAKDKQKNLNFMMNKLTDEIDIAKIINPENVNLDYVEFGTKVTFKDNKTNKTVSYTVLGPWESNPDKNVLNFQAPLGLKIYNMKLNENKKFEINEVQYDYTVVKIELADFELK